MMPTMVPSGAMLRRAALLVFATITCVRVTANTLTFERCFLDVTLDGASERLDFAEFAELELEAARFIARHPVVDDSQRALIVDHGTALLRGACSGVSAHRYTEPAYFQAKRLLVDSPECPARIAGLDLREFLWPAINDCYDSAIPTLTTLRIVDHADYARSLVAWRRVALLLAPYQLDGPYPMHEYAHALRPLLALTRARVYVEIGTYCGHSLALALSYLDAIGADGGDGSNDPLAVSIDPLLPYLPCEASLWVAKNCFVAESSREGGGGAHVESIVGLSQAPEVVARARELTAARGIDVLFIDGDHSAEGVVADFENYAPLVRPGGVIIFDDYEETGLTGVSAAIAHIRAVHGPQWHWIGQLPNAANASQFNEYEWDGKGSMSIEFVIQKREPSLET